MASSDTYELTEVQAAGLTHVGLRREHNEDALLLAPDLALYGVCDGVGGHSRGDVASALAVETMEDFFRNDRPVEDWIAYQKDLAPGARRLLAAVHRANTAIFVEGQAHGDDKSMGSTVVAAHVAGGLVHVCHVGDSRCYRFRDGRLEQLTRDHNMRNDALRLNPRLSEEVLSKMPTHVVTRALGAGPEVEPDVSSVEPSPGEVYLLCSDGLCGFVPDVEIANALELLGDDLELACHELVEMANAAGGKDNVSVVLVRVESVAEMPGAERRVEVPPCVWCGAEWVRGMSFCVCCGRAPVAEDEEELVTASCPSCGQELLPDTRFCGHCGAPHSAYD